MEDQDATRSEQPPHETTASPIEVSTAMPRYFGVTPPTFLLGVASATFAIAIVLAVLAHWVAALVLAAVVLLEIALFVSVARRKPDTAVARASVSAVRRARERAVWLVEATGVRPETGRKLTPLRRELLELAEQRDRLLRDLGAAVYEGEEEAAKRLSEDIRQSDEAAKLKEEQMRAIAESAQERLQQGRVRVQPTVIRRPGDGDERLDVK
jgi:type IV secretory pathway VirB3-like protein